VHAFNGTSDGGLPIAGLVQGADGSFYGCSGRKGGAHGDGTIFSVSPSGTFAVLHDLDGNAEGYACDAALVTAPDGSFFGMLSYGGPSGQGAVFRITPSGAFTLLHSFAGTADGGMPSGGFLLGTNGNLYGTLRSGGSGNAGALFRMTPAGAVTLLYSFTGGADGGQPLGGLVQGTDGSLYGTTETGGSNNLGTVFKFVPAAV
jgi:uncharacterized repeat protein (TIGR03803 family)